MIKFLNNVWNYPLRILFIFSIFIIPGYVISATIEVTDAEGNSYILYEDGTYKSMEKKGLSDSEIADRVVAAIVTYKNIYSQEVSQEQKDCMRKMVLDNKGKKWEKLHFMNQPWSTTAEWVETLPIREGLVTNTMEIATGQINIIGAMQSAGEYCGLE